MLSILVISTFVILLILIGILTLMFIVPFVNNLLEKVFRGELVVSIFQLFIIIFVLLIVIFGSFGLLMGLL